MKGFLAALIDREYSAKAVKVALFVGTLLFVINHGAAALKGEMNRTRWLSALLTYAVPYGVNVQGQYAGRRSQKSVGRRVLESQQLEARPLETSDRSR